MKLNTDRKFPANMVNAHTLLLKAKRGEKGIQRVNAMLFQLLMELHFRV